MKTMIAIPCMDTIQTEFARSLVMMRPVGYIRHAFLSCSLIYKSRNDLGKMAVSEGTDYVLWLDSDVVFPSSLMVDLMEIPGVALLVVSDNSSTRTPLVGRSEEQQKNYEYGRDVVIPEMILALAAEE